MYTDKYIHIQTLIITILLFSMINMYFLGDNKQENQNETNTSKSYLFHKEIENQEKNQEKEKVIHSEIQQDLNYWKIEIPKINLIAGIQEGVDSNILSQSVGHFEETSKIEGNIGLAGHNRGYHMNFFEQLKNLDIGDKIFYTYENTQKEYEITKMVIIKETDWSYLEKTQNNRITLITCVKDSPEYRLCVQAEETR